MRHAIAKATSLYHNSAQQITSTTKPCDSWPSSHVRTFVWFVIIIAFPIHHALGRSQLPSLTTTTTISSLTYVYVCVILHDDQKERYLLLIFPHNIHTIFFWCVFNFHIAKITTTHTHTHVRTHFRTPIHTYIQTVTDTDYIKMFAMPCHHLNYVCSPLVSYKDTSRCQISRKVKSEEWSNGVTMEIVVLYVWNRTYMGAQGKVSAIRN